jgi:site-specific DNA recombinase
MRVALYARVSGSRQREDATIESQRADLKRFVDEQGWEFESRHLYMDNGYSGARFDRPALDRLRDAARDGLIDVVVVHAPDRLARRYAHQILLMEEFQKWGVEVRFMNQPPPNNAEQKLLVEIQAAMAEYERAKILERTRRGRLFWARQGRPVSARVPFGYRYVPRNGQEPPHVEVDEGQHEVLLQIYRLCVEDRLSDREIALRLTHAGTPTPTGKQAYWDATTVGFILKDEAYLGTWYVNKHQVDVDAHRGRRVSRRPRDEWISISVPQLIDPEVFSGAQQRRRQRPRGRRPLTYPESHLLRRLVLCKSCQRKMSCANSKVDHNIYRYYACRGPDPHGFTSPTPHCPHPTIQAERLDAFVWSDVVALLTNPELILSAWTEQHGQEGIQLSEVIGEETRLHMRRLMEVKKQRERLLIAYEQSAIELEEMVSRREHLDQKAMELECRLHTLKRKGEDQGALANLSENITAICSALAEKLDTLSTAKKMELCRQLIARVEVDDHCAEIHYRFPVSTPCEKAGVGGTVFL